MVAVSWDRQLYHFREDSSNSLPHESLSRTHTSVSGETVEGETGLGCIEAGRKANQSLLASAVRWPSILGQQDTLINAKNMSNNQINIS